MSNMQNNIDSLQRDKQYPNLYSQVKSQIVEIRQIPVIIDADVAALYGVETKRVNEAVRNNPDKFPEDYMFVLSTEELQDLRSKNSSTKVKVLDEIRGKNSGIFFVLDITKEKGELPRPGCFHNGIILIVNS